MDPRFPNRSDCTLPALLEKWAADRPDATFAVFDDTGETWTYADTLDRARRAAAALQAMGVRRDERVVVWMPNGPAILAAWFGINLLGAVYVPVNLAYRGRILEHVVTNSGAKVALVHSQLAPRLEEVDHALEQVVVVGGPGRDPLDADPARYTAPERPVEPWDTQVIVYTSGTTGPSKGVLCSHLHSYTSAMAVMKGRLDGNDRYLVNTPLFHGAATLATHGALVLGASIAVVSSFETKEFWEVVRRTGTTACTLLGAMAAFLVKQPPAPHDAENDLRFAVVVPLIDAGIEFGRRFGTEIYTVFNMTEISTPLVSERNPTAVGSCGTPRPGVEVRLVDGFDREVPVGEVGELMVRTDVPWAMNSGYNAMPEATAVAWRNGWFHTGDAFRRDEAGNFFFVDRMKDAIRRRGENISSFEVEAEVLAHPGVQEAAAVAVPSEFGEDDVLVVVAPVAGTELDPADLLEFLIPRMAHFMVPRYVRTVAELPKTPTAKVEKYRLRSEGVTDDTWDREAAGISVRRERIT